eukprot:m.233367 g.233367  ORF g.233367 m.233367 type:complete len:272 (-) comp19293_c0_seq2:531-1346(-)
MAFRTQRGKNFVVETHSFPGRVGSSPYSVRVWKPIFVTQQDSGTSDGHRESKIEEASGDEERESHADLGHERTQSPVIVCVHPWSVLGGGEHNIQGIARILAESFGFIAVTFTLHSSGLCWGTLSSHAREVQHVTDVVEWVSTTLGRKVCLFGSSAGAPMAGSCLESEHVVSMCVVGYTFGWLSSIAFGRHYKHVTGSMSSEKPKLFIMGEHDEFTSVHKLETKVAAARGTWNKMIVVPDVGHFELESPSWDAKVVELLMEHQSDLLLTNN